MSVKVNSIIMEANDFIVTKVSKSLGNTKQTTIQSDDNIAFDVMWQLCNKVQTMELSKVCYMMLAITKN